MLLWLLGCEPPFEPPCRVVDRREVLDGVTPRLALGEVPEASEDATVRVVDVVVVEPGGGVRERFTFDTTVPASAVLGREVGATLLWAGGALVDLRADTQALAPDADGERLRSVLTLRSYPADGEPSPVVELSDTACVNCLLTWRAVAFDDQVVVLYSPRALSTDVARPVEPARVYALALTPGGDLVRRGGFAWPAAREPLRDVKLVDGRRALAVLRDEGVWWLDRDLTPVAGPFAWRFDEGAWAMDGDGDTFVAAWTDDRRNVLTRSFDGDGAPLGLATRLSEGDVAAARLGDDGARVALWDAGRAFVAVADADGKAGGDVALEVSREDRALLDAVFVDDLALLAVGTGRLEWLELGCDR